MYCFGSGFIYLSFYLAKVSGFNKSAIVKPCSISLGTVLVIYEDIKDC